MTTRTDLELEKRRSTEGFPLSPIKNDETIHVNELSEKERELIQKTTAQVPSIATPSPILAAPLAEERVTAVSSFPNLAFEAVNASLIQERRTNDKINEQIRAIEEQQNLISDLLDLSAECTAHKGGATSEKMRGLLAKLKEKGIELWKGEDTNNLPKEKVSEIKSLISAQIDKAKSNIQIRFTTKVQPDLQRISAIMEAVKHIINSNSRLINAANRLPGR